MSNTSISLKKSAVSGNVPASLKYGELAINYADGKLFYKDSSDVIKYIGQDAATGTSQDGFATINANSTLILATTPTDTLTFSGSGGISISTNTFSKTITIGDSDTYNLALSAQANTVYTQGVDATQNTNITNVEIKAQAAFDKANTSTGSSLDQFARDTANASVLLQSGINTTQNTSIVNIDVKAQAAFDKANTPIDQYARNTANDTVSLQSGINSTQNASISTASNQALTALTSITVLQGVNAGQNTLINTTQTNIQNVYNQANTALTTASAAFAAANTNLISIGTINGVNAGQNINITYATALAQAAFNKANTTDSNSISAVTRLTVTNSGSTAYLIDQYTGNNPAIYVSAGETIAFLLNNVVGHPFMIRTSAGGVNYDTGLVHVGTDGTVSTGTNAQGKTTGTLYWKVPFDLVNTTYVYQCSIHSGMVGNIAIQQPVSFVTSNIALALTQANSATVLSQAALTQSNSVTLLSQAAFNKANTADARAISSGDFANLAYLHASAAFNKANTAASGTIDLYARDHANAAFEVANNATGGVGGTIDSYARNHANAAFEAANSGGGGGATVDSYARDTANAALTTAINASGGGGNGEFASFINTFVGDSACTTFTLTTVPENKNLTTVIVGGVPQLKTAYDILGNVLTFDEAPESNVDIEITTYTSRSVDADVGFSSSVNTFVGDSACTTFILTTAPTSKNLTSVIVGGVSQLKSSYDILGNLLVLDQAPGGNVDIEITTFSSRTGAGFTSIIDTFVGDSACTAFTLSTVPGSKNLTSVIIGGVSQLKTSYELSNNLLTLGEAPPTNANIEVTTYIGKTTTQFNSVVDSFSGDNSTTTFTLSTAPQSANQTFAFLNGVYQQKSTYAVSNSNIIFSEAATSNDTIEVITVSGSEISTTSSRYKSRSYTGTGACTEFIISSSHSANSVLVFENGVCQEPITDYTVSGSILTFVTAPNNGIKIQIRELPV